MTFLRWYGLGAVGLTMLITCLGVAISLLFDAVYAFYSGSGGELIVDLMSLLQVSARGRPAHAARASARSPGAKLLLRA